MKKKEPPGEIVVLVMGATKRGGPIRLTSGATIKDALLAVGGFKKARERVRAGSIVTLDRPYGWDDDPAREVFRWDFSNPADAACWKFELQDRDGLAFSYDVDEDC